MTRISWLFVFLIMNTSCESPKAPATTSEVKGQVALVIHGGAGSIQRGRLTPEQESAYHQVLGQALDAGYAVLANGGKSVDAVISAIAILEDSPLFNAGKGAVFTHDGRNELDASIMEGDSLRAGAVAGVTRIKNPIKGAYAVMTQSKHVMLAGQGADEFAEKHGLDMVDPSYFVDSARYQQFLNRNRRQNSTGSRMRDLHVAEDKHFGTVGAVALDQAGTIAAGTSTGGMSDKQFGRIGDSPIIGAGTYANNETCGISSTGWGEYFIRLVVAHDISALMAYGNLSLQEAADSVIMKKLPRLGGNGGVIGLDRNGNITMTFNTPGMFRGYIRSKGNAITFLYGEEQE